MWEAIAKSLEIKLDGEACRVAGMGRSFPIVATAWTCNQRLPCSLRGKGRRILVTAGIYRILILLVTHVLHALRIRNRTNDRPWVQRLLAWHNRAALSLRCNFSIMPQEAGCHAVVLVRNWWRWPPLIGCRLLEAAETNNPDGDESFSDCLGGYPETGIACRWQWDSIGIQARMQRPDQVDMYREESAREFWSSRAGSSVANYLGTLAGYTCACPLLALIPHSGPQKHLG